MLADARKLKGDALEALADSSNRVLGGDGRQTNTPLRMSFREVSYGGRKKSIERLGVFHH